MPIYPSGWFGTWPDKLGDLSYYDRQLGDWYDDWYQYASGHYLGSTLIGPYIQGMYGNLYAQASMLESVGYYAQRTVDYLTDLNNGLNFTDLMAHNYPFLNGFELDIDGTFDILMETAFPDWYWFKQDPGFTVEYWLNESYDWFGAWLADPGTWFAEQLNIRWPDFEQIRTTPGQKVLSWLGSGLDFFEGVDTDVSGWFKSKVEQFTPPALDPWASPWKWLLNLLTQNIQASDTVLRDSFYNFGEHLLRWMIEGVW